HLRGRPRRPTVLPLLRADHRRIHPDVPRNLRPGHLQLESVPKGERSSNAMCTAECTMSGSWRKLGLRGGLGLGLTVLVRWAGIGWHRVRLGSWREELARARKAMDSGRYGQARDILSRLSKWWDNTGEVFLLLPSMALRVADRDPRGCERFDSG